MGNQGSKGKNTDDIIPTKPAPGFTGAPPEGALTATTMSDVNISIRDPRNQAISSNANVSKSLKINLPGYDDSEETISVTEAQQEIAKNWNRMIAENPEGQAAQAMNLLKAQGYRQSSPEQIEGFLSTMPMASKLQVPKSTVNYLSSEERAQITAREGLNIGQNKKKDLAQQFKWYALSDPVQHGIDAGIVGGVLSMAVSAYHPANRLGGMMLIRFVQGFFVGMSLMTGGAVAWAEYQSIGKYEARKKESDDRRRSFYMQSLESLESEK